MLALSALSHQLKIGAVEAKRPLVIGESSDELAGFWNAQPGITGGMHNVTINPGERVQVAGGCDKASQGPIISGGFGIFQTASLLLLASYPDPNILDPMPDNTDPGGNTPDQFLDSVRQEGWTTVWEHIGPSPIVADISVHTLCSGQP